MGLKKIILIMCRISPKEVLNQTWLLLRSAVLFASLILIALGTARAADDVAVLYVYASDVEEEKVWTQAEMEEHVNGPLREFWKQQSYGRYVPAAKVFVWRMPITSAELEANKKHYVIDSLRALLPNGGDFDVPEFNPSEYAMTHILLGGNVIGYGGGMGTGDLKVNGELFAGLKLGSYTYSHSTSQYWIPDLRFGYYNPGSVFQGKWNGEVIGYPELGLNGDDGTFLHEWGHGLGLSTHANSWRSETEPFYGEIYWRGKSDFWSQESDYGNLFDVMGGSPHLSLHINAFYKELLGWIQPDEKIVISATKRDIQLNPLESSNTPKVQTAQIPVSGKFSRPSPFDNSMDYSFYIEYRRPMGLDQHLDHQYLRSNTEGIMVYMTRRQGTGFINSWLLDMSPDNVVYDKSPTLVNLSSANQSDDHEVSLNAGKAFYDKQTGWTLTNIRPDGDQGILFDAEQGEKAGVASGIHTVALFSGNSLSPDNVLRSSDLSYYLSLGKDGNIVVRKSIDNSVVWQSQNVSIPVDSSANQLAFNNGNLSLTGSGKTIWSSNTGDNPGARLVVSATGSPEVLSTMGKVLWPTQVNVLKPQTLTVAGGDGLAYLGAGVAIAGSSDSGLPVTLSLVSGPAKLENGQLIPTGVGSVRLKASQSGDANWSAASIEVERVVAKASQTLSFGSLTDVAYNKNALVLDGKASSGLTVGYRVVSGAATVTGNQLSLSGVGTIAVAADQEGDTNWLAAKSVTNSFTVSRGVQTIAFNAIGDKIFGDRPVTLVATSSVNLPVTFRVMSGPGTLNGAVLSLIGAGDVVIQAIQVGTDAYLPASASQTITVKATVVPPAISTQPLAAVTLTEGETASLSVKATGDEPLSYQWFLNSGKIADGVNVSGATTATLKLTNIELTQAGSYSVSISNASGSVTSTVSKVTVNQAPINGPSDNWTVLIYGHADHNLSPSLITDMLEMERVGSGGGLNIVVQADFDGSSKQNDGLDPALATGVSRFLMAKNPNQTERRLISPVVERLNESNNMDDPKVLEAFIAWGVKKYPAKNYAMVFWDHGGQWQGFGGDTQDGTTHSPGLSTAQIRAAIDNTKAATQVEKWAFLSFDTCLMGGLEVLYDFAPLTDVFIACPELDYGDGWNYEVLEVLRQTPTITPLEFGKAEVDSWRTHHSVGEADIKLAAHSLYDLTKFDSFERNYLAFAASVNQNATAIQKSLAVIRRETTSYSIGGVKEMGNPTDYIDLGELAERLQQDASVPDDIKVAALAMNTSLGAMVTAKVLGTEKLKAHGLSIFYPERGSADNAGYLNLTASKIDGTAWPSFLAAIQAASSADSEGPTIALSGATVGPGNLNPKSGVPSLKPGLTNTLSFRVETGDDIYSYSVSLVDPNFTGKADEFVYYGEIANRRASGLGIYKLPWNGTIPAFKDAKGNTVFLGGFYDDPLSTVMVSFAEYLPPDDTDAQWVTLLTETSGNKPRIVAVLDDEAGSLAPKGIDLEPGGILQPVYFMERRKGNDPEEWEEDSVYSKNSIVIPAGGLSGVTVTMAPVPAGAYSVEIQASDVFNFVGDVVAYDLVVESTTGSSPKLAFTTDAAGTSITITWAPTSTAFKLQRVSALGGPWLDIPDSQITTQNGLKVFKAVSDSISGFFRLTTN
jgi:hypothetical protein